MHHHDDGELHDHDRGLSHDLPRLVERGTMARRGVLALFGGLGAAGLVACAADDSGGVDVSSRGTAPGGGPGGAPPAGEDATPLTGAAVYLWHCNRDGEYSLYSQAVASENYLRGVQEAGDDGSLEFTSIFPAAYDGRWPHIHFEVYKSLDDATSATNKLRTSQLALPEDVCTDVYATEGYEASVGNLASTSLSSDMVFADGHSLQLATVTGNVDEGYVASLNVPV